MRKPLALALFSAALALFSVLAYEPATISNTLHLQGHLDEASVVVLSLLIVSACFIAGFAALRSPALAAIPRRTSQP